MLQDSLTLGKAEGGQRKGGAFEHGVNKFIPHHAIQADDMINKLEECDDQ